MDADCGFERLLCVRCAGVQDTSALQLTFEFGSRGLYGHAEELTQGI